MSKPPAARKVVAESAGNHRYTEPRIREEKKPCRCPNCGAEDGYPLSQQRDSPKSMRRRMVCPICDLQWDQIDFHPEWHLIHWTGR